MALDYYLIASGPGPVVTVNVSGFGNSSFAGGSFLSVQSPPGFAPISVSSPFATNWVLNTSFSATVGIPYQVHLAAQIALSSAGNGLLTQSALVDPIFTVDPGFPNAGQYRLDFSPGIGNGGVSSVPEPSYAGLIAAALGLSLVWKRRRINDVEHGRGTL